MKGNPGYPLSVSFDGLTWLETLAQKFVLPDELSAKCDLPDGAFEWRWSVADQKDHYTKHSSPLIMIAYVQPDGNMIVVTVRVHGVWYDIAMHEVQQEYL
jgi:hypothetical protein